MKSFKHGVSRIGRHGLTLLAALAALAVISACGGSTSQIEPFAPTRIIAFGDESSLITATGKKYTVNSLDSTTGNLDCAIGPIWVQSVASVFGLVFPQCNPSNYATPQGVMYATAGAKVADLQAKITAHFSSSTFGPKDLVTIMVGANDVFELYGQYPAQSQSNLLAAAQARGKLLGQQVNRIANANGRVVVSTLIDLGLTPFAITEKALFVDTDRAAFLTQLTATFNIAMRLEIINDGRLIGLVLADESVQAIVKYPAAFGFADVTSPACLKTIAMPDCTSLTLFKDSGGDTTKDASASTWLWANDRLLGIAGQERLGLLAQTRAKNNPF